MAVGYVASASSGSQASVATFNIGTLGTGARAGIVFVCIHNSATDIITGVTWNSVAMTELYKATDTDTEPGVTKAYFLNNVTNGVITVSRTNNTVVTVGYAASISADKDCAAYQTITRVSSTQNTNANTSTTGTGASGEVAVDDGSPGTSSMRFAAAYSGAATPPSNGTNSTALQVLDSTSYGSRFVRETTAGQGSRSVGGATGTTDDWALVAVAVREENRNASVVSTGGGVLAATSAGAHASSPVNTGGGVAAVAGFLGEVFFDDGRGVVVAHEACLRSFSLSTSAAAIWLGVQPYRLRDFFAWLFLSPGRARGLGGALLTALVDASDDRVEFAFAEARTVHPKTQKICDCAEALGGERRGTLAVRPPVCRGWK